VAPVLGALKPFRRGARNLKGTEPQAACENALDDQPEEYLCECTDLSINQTLLSCLDVTCNFCNADSSVCGSGMYEEIFGLIGDTDYIAESFIYGKGLNDTVTIALDDCDTDEETGESMCMGCSAIVNEVRCSSCVVQNCTSGPSIGQSVPAFDCSNVEAGAVIDLCDSEIDVPTGSVFEFLNTGSFENCTLTTPAPTQTASESPTMTPSDIPSDMPSLMPSGSPTTSAPSISMAPTINGTTSAPTSAPTVSTTPMPTPTEPVVPTTSAPTSEDNAGTPAPTGASGAAGVFTRLMVVGTVVASIVAAAFN
jgi:hypothetical protein